MYNFSPSTLKFYNRSIKFSSYIQKSKQLSDNHYSFINTIPMFLFKLLPFKVKAYFYKGLNEERENDLIKSIPRLCLNISYEGWQELDKQARNYV